MPSAPSRTCSTNPSTTSEDQLGGTASSGGGLLPEVVLPNVATALLSLPLLRLSADESNILRNHGVRGLIRLFQLRAIRANKYSRLAPSKRRELEGGYCGSRYCRVRLSSDRVITKKIPKNVRYDLS